MTIPGGKWPSSLFLPLCLLSVVAVGLVVPPNNKPGLCRQDPDHTHVKSSSLCPLRHTATGMSFNIFLSVKQSQHNTDIRSYTKVAFIAELTYWVALQCFPLHIYKLFSHIHIHTVYFHSQVPYLCTFCYFDRYIFLLILLYFYLHKSTHLSICSHLTTD